MEEFLYLYFSFVVSNTNLNCLVVAQPSGLGFGVDGRRPSFLSLHCGSSGGAVCILHLRFHSGGASRLHGWPSISLSLSSPVAHSLLWFHGGVDPS